MRAEDQIDDVVSAQASADLATLAKVRVWYSALANMTGFATRIYEVNADGTQGRQIYGPPDSPRTAPR